MSRRGDDNNYAKVSVMVRVRLSANSVFAIPHTQGCPDAATTTTMLGLVLGLGLGLVLIRYLQSEHATNTYPNMPLMPTHFSMAVALLFPHLAGAVWG